MYTELYFERSYNRYLKVTLPVYVYFTDPNKKRCYRNDSLLFFWFFTLSLSRGFVS